MSDSAQLSSELLRLNPTFMWAARTMADLPPMTVTEVAFAGRSNVGKSSLVNAVLNRKNMARASSEPGRTREMIFFTLKNKEEVERVRIVDLPGYGYAKAPKTEIHRWTSATREFLKGRAVLKRVFVLIDARHGIKDNDIEVLKELDTAAVVYQIILTKADKLKPAGVKKIIEETQDKIKKRPAAHPVVLAVSSHSHLGLDELRAEILRLDD